MLQVRDSAVGAWIGLEKEIGRIFPPERPHAPHDELQGASEQDVLRGGEQNNMPPLKNRR